MLKGQSYQKEKMQTHKGPSYFSKYLIILFTNSGLLTWSGETAIAFYNKAYSLREIEGIMTGSKMQCLAANI